ncbi:MAG: hypothetical protein HOD49_01520 [Anaerolineae bacterium]|jgi:photosystem II stability/assembly factor-like uncharacterized protein|nr:hypothetical protein [Anaerolineae bacterium]MBT6324204.1 hypothetical protein [Anaerolineae bacterium]
MKNSRITFHASRTLILLLILTFLIGCNIPAPDTTSAPEPPALEQGPSTAGVPAYESEPWVKLGGPPGGVGYDIRMRPDNPDIMFVTDVVAGVHKSVDGGRTWFQANNGIFADATGGVPIFSLTIDPHNYDVIWAGTYLNGHLYRSMDNGESWERRDNGIVHDGRSWRGISVDPNYPEIVYLAGEVSAWMFDDDLGRVRGEVYKSMNGGESWELIWEGENLARYVLVDPRNSDRIYVSTGIFDRDPANSDKENGVWGGVGILRSDDGGMTWEVLNKKNGLNGIMVPSIFMHPENPDILIAGATGPFGGPFLESSGVYVTYNGGDDWEQILQNPAGGIEAVEIAVSKPNIWYAAGNVAEQATMIWRSDDSGQTWQSYPIQTEHRMAGFPIDLQVDPRDPYRIFDNNYGGGNFLSENGGETWVDASMGYTGLPVGGIGVAPWDAKILFANEFRSNDGGMTWIGSGVMASKFVFPPSDDKHIIAPDWETLSYSDDGERFEMVPILDVGRDIAAGRLDGAAPMRAFAYAPSDPQIMYAGFASAGCFGDRPWDCPISSPQFRRSFDGGLNWEIIEGAPFENTGILALDVHPHEPRNVYAATVIGVYLSEDGGGSWRHLQALREETMNLPRGMEPAPGEAFVIYDVLVDPFEPNMIYAATLEYALWRSADGGESWEQASAGMDPNQQMFGLLADPNRPGVIYASTSLSGIFVTTDGGDSWRQLGDGLDFFNMKDMALSADGSVLYVGTGGRGVYRLGTP